ncbi:MAG: DnaJ domain-containing protein, partial [Spirochaetaceae bacterium]|nr:DnaJ domain-containing protein [Spirochaetaceae bacterium]
MKSLYDLLGIEKTADKAQIKRGYFNQVRKYPPERFPEEFKALRAAYETLSDEEKRAEYDEIGAMPEVVAVVFREAQRANQLGLHAEASDLYRKILKRSPALTTVKEKYAWSLNAEGKSGKAVEVWESLYRQEPDNQEYAMHLADAYRQRGWHKKALTQYRRALKIDESNVECWSDLIHCLIYAEEKDEARRVCREALEAVGENEYIPLYVHAFLLVKMDDKASAEGYLQAILALMRAGKMTEEMNLHDAIWEILSALFTMNLMNLFPYIQQMADMLPDKHPQFLLEFEEAKRIHTIMTLKEKGFSSLLHDLLLTLAAAIDSDEEQQQQLVMEWLILS